MDSALSPTAPARLIPIADLRPTADAAAIVRDPRPIVSLPIPASTAQAGAVTQSSLTGRVGLFGADRVEEVERVLKPYGIRMLAGSPIDALIRAEDDAASGK